VRLVWLGDGRGAEDMPDLQAAVMDDDPLDHQLENGALVGLRGGS
jgi:hypothetical protein